MGARNARSAQLLSQGIRCTIRSARAGEAIYESVKSRRPVELPRIAGLDTTRGNSLGRRRTVQLIPEKDEFKFPFDLLDATKLVPEELVPVQIMGRMVLDRNPDNYFAEIEQVAFHPANLVPGIDFSNDPL